MAYHPLNDIVMDTFLGRFGVSGAAAERVGVEGHVRSKQLRLVHAIEPRGNKLR